MPSRTVKDSTALGVTKSRLAESMLPSGTRCFEDPFAGHFLAGVEEAIAKMGIETFFKAHDKAFPGLNSLLILRTKWFDDLVMEAVSGGCIRQVLILGAGYDMRGFRLNLPEGVKTFEVDRPDIQLHKQAMLASLPPHLAKVCGGKNLDDRVCFVPVDFDDRVSNCFDGSLQPEEDQQQLLKAALMGAGFDPCIPVVALMEGLTQYIPIAATEALLGTLGTLCSPGSVLGASYIDGRTFDSPGELVGAGWGEKGAKLGPMLENIAKTGEPWITGFHPGRFKDLANAKGGFVVEKESNMWQLSETYFVPRGRPLSPESKFNIEVYASARIPDIKGTATKADMEVMEQDQGWVLDALSGSYRYESKATSAWSPFSAGAVNHKSI